MPDKEKAHVGSSGRWVKGLLGLSLAINLAFVGLLAGALLRHEGGGDRGARGPGLGAFGAPYMIALPRAQRRDVLRTLRSSQGDEVPDRAMRRQMYQDVVSLLRTTPLDKVQLLAAIARQAEASVSVQQRAHSAWAEVISDMSDEERSAYASALEEVLKRGPKKR